MNSKQKTLIGLLAFVVIMMAAYIAYDKLSEGYTGSDVGGNVGVQDSSSGEPDDASDFTVMTKDMNRVSLSDFRGRGVVVNFWATWCPPCKKELPYFESMYTKYSDREEFMMVNLTDGNRETVDIVKSFINRNGYTFPVYYDTSADAAYSYGVSSIPVTLFIDSKGRLVHRQTGAMSEAVLELFIEKIL